MAIKNKEAIEKVLAMQEKLIPKLEKLDADRVLTSDVAEAVREAGEWDYQYENRNRLDLEPRRWEPHKLARLLHKHIAELAVCLVFAFLDCFSTRDSVG